MKRLFLLSLLLVGCHKKKPVAVWTNNRCDDEWIEYEDGFHYTQPGGAVGAEHLNVPCTSSPDIDGALTWIRKEIKEKL